MGDLWPEMLPHAGEAEIVVSGSEVRAVRLPVQMPEMEPFRLLALAHGYAQNQRFSPRLATGREAEYNQTDASDRQAVARFLLQRRHKYEEHRAFQAEKERRRQQEQREREVHQARNNFNRVDHDLPTPAAADALLARMLKIDPAHEPDWRQRRANWQALYERKQAAEAQERRLVETYRQAYQAYVVAHRAALEGNRARLARLQAELDTPFTVATLTYGVTATDEGERYVDVDTVVMLSTEPDPDGYSGAVKKVRYCHVVSVTAAEETRPTDETHARCLYVSQADQRLYFSPHLAQEEALARLDALGLEPLPDPPRQPGGLNAWECEEIEREVKREFER